MFVDLEPAHMAVVDFICMFHGQVALICFLFKDSTTAISSSSDRTCVSPDRHRTTKRIRVDPVGLIMCGLSLNKEINELG